MSPTLFRNLCIFDGERVFQGSVVIEDVITSVTESDDIPSSAEGFTIVEGEDLTLLPGLIDSHVHVNMPSAECFKVLEPALSNGVTTICDMHNNPGLIQKLKEMCSKSNSLPDLKSACYAATIQGGWPKPIVLKVYDSPETREEISNWPNVTPDRAEEFVKQNKEQGADYIKLMQDNGSVVGWPQIPTASLELQKAIVSASHRHNLLAVAHATNMEDTMLVLHAGVDGLAHTFLDQPPSPELIDLYRSTNAFLIPTLSILASITGSERSTTAHFASSIPDPTTKATMCDALNLPGPNASISHAYASVRALKAAGIDIVAGTDAVPGVKGTAIGPSLLQELYLYVERCGLSAVEALRSATGTAARRFGFEDRGRIEVGRRADLVLVRGNPVAEGRIEDLRRVVGVWKEGVRCI